MQADGLTYPAAGWGTAVPRAGQILIPLVLVMPVLAGVLAGVLGALLPAMGYFPALGGDMLS
ncbi:MAG TPA: hypothetical protein DGU02_04795, partial [Alphaproteobacteria bacterium]|nr:hypothetical protein [Alphaproteobacteria bacterium]